MERPKKEEKDTQNGNSAPEVYDLDLIQLLDMCYQSPHPTPLPSWIPSNRSVKDAVWFMQTEQPSITLGLLPEGGDGLAAWPGLATFIPSGRRQTHPALASRV